MCNRTRGRKQDNEQREALASREKKRRAREAAEEFAATVFKMIGN
ncbi:hypothetical protein NVP1029O_57 [Vibrio phage 1.029.O._10N.261.55.A7]|nr:hypothetical protein NVP1029O_57 [Vibrio phage 1.029.O._10N.261.55.A7]